MRRGDGAGILESSVRGGEEIGLRIHTGELDGLDERVEEGGDFGAALGAGSRSDFPGSDAMPFAPSFAVTR